MRFLNARFGHVARLKSFLDDCDRKILSSGNITHFKFDDVHRALPKTTHPGWGRFARKLDRMNKDLLDGVSGRAGVYGIFISARKSKSWKLVYIGHTNALGARQRIRNHFITKGEGTGAKLKLVRLAVMLGYDIGFSFVAISPPSMRLVVEEELIAKHRHRLYWHGGKKRCLLPADLSSRKIKVSRLQRPRRR